MKQVTKILFPTDFSEAAKAAYQYALQLAKDKGATLELLNVYRGDFGVPVPEVMAYSMLEARKDEAENLLTIFAQDELPADAKDVAVTTAVEMGLAADVVVDYVNGEDANIDLIVMGTKGEHNLMEKVFGSVTTAVIKRAKVPVLAIPEGANYDRIKTIAYATDMTHETQETLQAAAQTAALFGAELHCVCVDTKQQDLNAQIAEFHKLVESVESEQVIKIAQVGSDTVAHGLDSYMQENGVDLLLMMRPQRGLFERIFHRSVTQQVAHYISRPLLVFHQPK